MQNVDLSSQNSWKMYGNIYVPKQVVQPSDHSLPFTVDGNKGKSRFHNKWDVITITAILK